jgi:hypothetical protein
MYLYIAGKADPAFVIRASPGTSFIQQFPVAQKEDFAVSSV